MKVPGRSHLDVSDLKLTDEALMFRVAATCPECGQQTILLVHEKGLHQWLEQNTLIQDALPDLNDTQREQLMTGYCQPCWDEMWAEDDEIGPEIREDFHADG